MLKKYAFKRWATGLVAGLLLIGLSTTMPVAASGNIKVRRKGPDLAYYQKLVDKDAPYYASLKPEDRAKIKIPTAQELKDSWENRPDDENWTQFAPGIQYKDGYVKLELTNPAYWAMGDSHRQELLIAARDKAIADAKSKAGQITPATSTLLRPPTEDIVQTSDAFLGNTYLQLKSRVASTTGNA